MYFCLAVGIPFHTAHAAKDVSRPFPCMHCQCGCRDAEQCWARCCCHTLSERVAWARQNGVVPPKSALEKAKIAGIDLSWLVSDMRPATKSGCKLHLSSAMRTCCADAGLKQSPKNESTSTTENAERVSSRADGIIGWRALLCQGQSTEWLAGPPTTIVRRPMAAGLLPVIGWLGPATSDFGELTPAEPAVPPPRRA